MNDLVSFCHRFVLACSLVSGLFAVAIPLPLSAADLQAGAATNNITPPLGTLRAGSFAPYPTVHVHDELHARSLVLDDGKTTLALVVCDLLGLHRAVSVEARRHRFEPGHVQPFAGPQGQVPTAALSGERPR